MIDEIGDNGIVLEDGRTLSWLELGTILTELKEFVANSTGHVRPSEMHIVRITQIFKD